MRYLPAIIGLCLHVAASASQDDHVLQSSVYILMPDGTRLYSELFTPPIQRELHAILIQTPYGTSSVQYQARKFADSGFAVLIQDFRGRFRSTGAQDFFRSSGSDAYTTMEWISQQPWASGRVFVHGFSADGIAAYLAALNRPPWLAASVVQCATAQLHEMVYHGGALRLSLIDGWLKTLNGSYMMADVLRNEGVAPFWNRTSLDGAWGSIVHPGVHVSGWYDVFLQWQLDAWWNSDHGGTGLAVGRQFLVVLPGGHCRFSWANASYGQDLVDSLTTAMFSAVGDLPKWPLSEADLPSAGAIMDARLGGFPKVTWYVLGSDVSPSPGGFWAASHAFPAASPHVLFLAANGSLADTRPAVAVPVRFIDNQMHGFSPTFGGSNLVLPCEYYSCGPLDQANYSEDRPDVLVFVSAPLNKRMAITGRISATLFVSSNTTDTDVAVRLSDFHPDGRSLLIQDGIVRMRWREGGAAARPIVPGAMYRADVDLWSTSYVLEAGHRIRLSVAATNFPRFSLNPHTGEPLSSNSTSFEVSEMDVFVGGLNASRLVLPVIPYELLEMSRV